MQLDVPQEPLRFSEKYLFMETFFGEVCLETGNFTKISPVLFKKLTQILSELFLKKYLYICQNMFLM